ncbi:MAG: oxidoreductase [Mycobacterium sp.]|nr:oxidoreductase [Mycobacterium sp.]
MSARWPHSSPRWNGASVIGTVRRAEDVQEIDAAVCDSVVALGDSYAVSAIRAVAGGVHRVIEVSLSDHVDLDAAVVADGAVIAAYASRGDRPSVPFWPLLFANVSVRMLGSDEFTLLAKTLAVQDLTSAAAIGALTVPVSARYPLTDVPRSDDHVDAGAHGRVLLTIAYDLRPGSGTWTLIPAQAVTWGDGRHIARRRRRQRSRETARAGVIGWCQAAVDWEHGHDGCSLIGLRGRGSR